MCHAHAHIQGSIFLHCYALHVAERSYKPAHTRSLTVFREALTGLSGSPQSLSLLILFSARFFNARTVIYAHFMSETFPDR